MRAKFLIETVLLSLILGECLGVPGCGIEGINNANPKLTLRVVPEKKQVEITSNRDDTVRIKNLKAKTAGGGEFSLEEAEFIGNASDVRRANGDSQMPGMALQATANWQGGADLADSVFNGFAKIVPGLNQLQATRMLGQVPRSRSIPTPYGMLQTGQGLSEQQVQALIAMAQPAPASQPGK